MDGPPLLPGESHLKAIPGITYVVAGLEHDAPGAGTPHLQGAISFKSPRTERSVRRLLPGCHVEIQRGSHSAAHTYCKKDGKYFEFGSPTLDATDQAAKQSEDYAAAWSLAVAGNTSDIEPSLRVRYYRTWTLIHRDHQLRPKSLADVCGHWIYGPSGTGKSHFVNSQFEGCYIKDASKWWCGFSGEDTVWLDDVDPTQSGWLTRFLKIWGDKYPFQAQSKGGSLVIRPKRIIITSNYSIAEMGFPIADLAAIRRRYVEHHKLDRDTLINIL